MHLFAASEQTFYQTFASNLSGTQSYRPDFSKGVCLLQAGKSSAIKHAQTEDVEQEAGVVVWPRLRCSPVSDGRCRKSVGMETDLSAPHYSHTPHSKKKKKTSRPASRLGCSCSQFQALARAAFA